MYDLGSSLRALAPGRSALVPLYWMNWCSPHLIGGYGDPPAAMEIRWLRSTGPLRIRVGRAPRCDAPDGESTLAVGGFSRRGRQAPENTRLPLRIEIAGVKNYPSGKFAKKPVFVVHRGQVLRYAIRLVNTANRPYRFRGCPEVDEYFYKGAQQRYLLNCTPIGTLQPGAQAILTMRARVDDKVPIGRAFFALTVAPRTYLPPNISVPILVTR